MSNGEGERTAMRERAESRENDIAAAPLNRGCTISLIECHHPVGFAFVGWLPLAERGLQRDGASGRSVRAWREHFQLRRLETARFRDFSNGAICQAERISREWVDEQRSRNERARRESHPSVRGCCTNHEQQRKASAAATQVSSSRSNKCARARGQELRNTWQA